ncbi:hypothetical protein, variant [Verruconis gallopava]|uniref:Uncharacterized protein n=1 Tax=Verruconis gallopava TaxID=253628 RepID=A0A0D2BBD5_9PEZI|nr:hypothetical protein, variant [Verruconis gallopava]KIW08614.1 hypothetical protein, variant [Verruconis gallopava]
MSLSSEQRRDDPVSSVPSATEQSPSWVKSPTDVDQISNTSSSRSGSASEAESTSRSAQKPQRPKLHTRKSSGTIIVPAGTRTLEIEEEYDEGDARTMSPRRSSEEVDRLEEGLRQNMIEQSKQLQASLLSLVDRVESVKAEHEKLEGGNRFLQSYIGELMQTSKITAAGATKGKGKQRK